MFLNRIVILKDLDINHLFYTLKILLMMFSRSFDGFLQNV